MPTITQTNSDLNESTISTTTTSIDPKISDQTNNFDLFARKANNNIISSSEDLDDFSANAVTAVSTVPSISTTAATNLILSAQSQQQQQFKKTNSNNKQPSLQPTPSPNEPHLDSNNFTSSIDDKHTSVNAWLTSHQQSQPQQQQPKHKLDGGMQAFSPTSTTLDNQKQKLNKLIELISNQEAKLNRLKELRKISKEQTGINTELRNQLKVVNDTISIKSGELREALDRVDNLNRQLSNCKRARANRNSGINSNNISASSRGSIVETDSNSKKTKNVIGRRVSFDPLALLLDAALEGELDLVIQTSKQVPDLNASHDECVTALHNAAVAGHYEVARYLIEAGCDINVQDSDGWTPLHCAASCNNLPLAKLLVENGALIYATTNSDNSTPAMKCEPKDANYEDCYEYLMYIQNNLGVINNGVVYALYDYDAQKEDELSFETDEELMVLRRDDSQEAEWWWAQKRIRPVAGEPIVELKEGYIPRNMVGLYKRVKSTRFISGGLGQNVKSTNGL